ncbi:tetratricopeptide repeat protein [Blastopirellula retiformator]|uniref:Uncharacterized protein n=1 Tax=Blastopirellula retiformator TaxID=2527970 RepID=A0A5C5VMT4_9BACT|nr:tetratricopeptide repeat protein [Blastopirellula retiformator]TWT39320.1 hypothetical protein Enr8_10180 [Blastopirellula retiformator]
MKSRLLWIRTLLVAAIVFVVLSQLLRPSLVGQWYWASALEKLEAGENDQAIELGQKAVDWSGDSAAMRMRMAELLYRVERNEEALALLEPAEESEEEDVTLLPMKNFLLSRMGEHERALALADDLIAAADEGKFHRHRALNNRAYATALALSDDAELPPEALEQAQKDIEEAIGIYGADASYLDTRGYVKHFAGDNEGAVGDLNVAIEIYQSLINQVEEEEDVWGTMKEMRLKQAQGMIGVLYHHRGEALKALGREEDAKRDFEQADKMGYSRQKGHW